ncbi:acyl-homoserine-lactone synthase [Vibrio rotiferianus]|uniref:acyl-homoserine-lactone synthase n=1 Tax=Vibrio rotiferianus TaxID=190895 RepID=UPI00406A2290
MAQHSTEVKSSLKLHHDSRVTKETAFEAFIRLETHQGEHILKEVCQQRISDAKTIDPSLGNSNLLTVVASKAYKIACLSASWEDFPLELKSLESTVHDHYSSWLDFWCDFLIYKLRKRYQGFVGSEQAPHYTYLPRTDDYYKAELVNITDSDELFLTPYCNEPMTLADAIVMSNLQTLVRQEQWYEILFDLELSQNKTHFVLTAPGIDSGHRYLISSARIQCGKVLSEWLFFSHYFNNSLWHFENSNELVQLLVQQKVTSEATASNASLQHHLRHHALNKNAICEIIRLAISAPHSLGLYFLYLSQKRLSEVLDENQFCTAFIITQNPAMLYFYQSMSQKSYTNLAFFSSGSEQINKGMWYLPNVRRDFETTDFRSYKTKVLAEKRSQN